MFAACSPSGLLSSSSRTACETTGYRTVDLSQIEDRIYLLECFTKDPRKTERHDLGTRKARLAQAPQQLRKELKGCETQEPPLVSR
jgi:hypothetical protein